MLATGNARWTHKPNTLKGPGHTLQKVCNHHCSRQWHQRQHRAHGTIACDPASLESVSSVLWRQQRCAIIVPVANRTCAACNNSSVLDGFMNMYGAAVFPATVHAVVH